MSELSAIKNAKIVLGDETIEGGISVSKGKITSVDHIGTASGLDFDGDYLLPGLVELHTDHLENHYRPRPRIFLGSNGGVTSP